MSVCYLDTSAIAKRYVDEAQSEAVEEFLTGQVSLVVTDLTTVEMRSMLARRRRDGEVDAAFESQAFAAYLDDIRQGYLLERPLATEMLAGAVHLIAQLPDLPLRTLDAIHLAAAQHVGAERLVTADRRMRDAAEALGMSTDFFGKG